MSFSELLISLKTKIITYHDSLQQIKLKSNSNHTHVSLEKMSLFISGSVRGSITLETAMVLPIFLFFMLTVFVFFDVIYEQSVYQRNYAQDVKNMAMLSLDSEREFIRLEKNYKVIPEINFFPENEINGYVLVGARAWTGRNADDGISASRDDQKVYVTEMEGAK